VLDNNKKATVDFSIKELKFSTPIALNLLKSMLEINPANRPTAADCLKHEFFTTNQAASMILDDEPMEIDLAGNLNDFKAKYKDIKGGAGAGAMTDSIRFNANPTIKGNIDTYGSVNAMGKGSDAQGNINSFHSINKQAADKGQIGKLKNEGSTKRSSIYKYALTKGG
jgi:serine/threonine protein kinase